MPEPLFMLGGLPVTAYALGMAISLSLVAFLVAAGLKRAGYPPRVAEVFLLIALPLGLLLSRLAYVLIRFYFFLGWGEGLAFRFWQGGYSVWGAVLGFLLAVGLTARANRVKAAPLNDLLMPYALKMLALGRFCEGLAGLGFGQEVPSGLAFFPIAVGNEYGEWRFAVFMLEGVAALLFALLAYRYPKQVPGDASRLALILFCAFQILFESLRKDEVLSWGFVKSSQVMGAAGLLILMVEGLFFRKKNSWRQPRHLALAGFALLVLLIAGLEYAVDKTSININLIYALMTGCCLGLCALTLRASTLGKAKPSGSREATSEIAMKAEGP